MKFGTEKNHSCGFFTSFDWHRSKNIDTSCPLVKKHVLPIMRNDELSRLVKEDKLIIELGEIWMVKSYGNKLHVARNKTSSFRMRLCARLPENVRILTGISDLAVTDILSPKYFDDVVKVTLDLCKLDVHDGLKHPSVALKVGYELGRLAGLKLCSGIKQQNDEKCMQQRSFWN